MYLLYLLYGRKYVLFSFRVLLMQCEGIACDDMLEVLDRMYVTKPDELY